MPGKTPLTPHPAAQTTRLQTTLQQAGNLLQSKDYAEAQAVCQRFLAEAPDNLEVLNLAGSAAYFAGQLDQAEHFFNRAIQLAPGQPWLHVNLANTLNNAGKTQAAIHAYETALKLAPDEPKILALTGNLYARSGNATAAARIYIRLQNLVPNHAAALSFLEQFYKKVVEEKPDHGVALENLGIILMQMNKPEEAKAYLLRANDLVPQSIDILANLAQVYSLLDEPQNAEPIYHQALAIDPNNAALHHSLGTILVNLGKMSAAETSFRNAIRLDPECVQAHQNLSYLIKHTDHDDDIRAMEEILKQTTLNTLQKSSLNFGLGKAYEDLCDYDRAFGYYAAANELKRSTIDYDIASDEQYMGHFLRAFNTKLFERLQNCGHPSAKPVFIVGMPRSGTTLVEQILSCHPDVHGAGELKHLSTTVRSYFKEQLHCDFPKNLQPLTHESVDKIARRYLDKLSEYSDARRIINKMPHNFLYVGMIRLLFPNATIIHCRRDPIDTCLSCYVTDFRNGQNYSYRLDELGQYYGLYYRVMQHWRQLQIDNLVDIDYEALVNDQERQTRRLLDACGLEWNDACLQFHKSDRPVMTASVNQVRNGIYNKSVQRWKHFEPHLKPLIDALGDTVPEIKNHV